MGEGGVRLSGGQVQRIAIARALIHNPSILIFDEATSALDTESEQSLQRNMAEIFANRTAVVVAHRLSTVKEADRILVMERGRIVEQGTHRELIDQRGAYYHLASQQI